MTDERYSCFLLTLQYQGSNYMGWQRQGSELPMTVQQLLEEAFTKLIKIPGTKTLASSRTDTGVHALDQRVRLVLPMPLPIRAVMKGGNGFLPKDIRIMAAVPIEESFHPIRKACWKEYRYFFYVGEKRAVYHNWWTHAPFAEFDIKAMQEASRLFVGDHVFHNFYCEGTPVKSFVRKIYECEIIACKSPEGESAISIPFMGGDFFCFRVIGRGFLKQMVRLMVGTLWEIGLHRVTQESLKEALDGHLPPLKRLGPVAPPQGLYLQRVSFAPYPDYK